MDVEGLRNRIQSTLDPNADIRRQAELDLKYVCSQSAVRNLCQYSLLISFSKAEDQPGFTNALLDILQAEQNNGVQLSGRSCLTFSSQSLG